MVGETFISIWLKACYIKSIENSFNWLFSFMKNVKKTRAGLAAAWKLSAGESAAESNVSSVNLVVCCLPGATPG